MREGGRESELWKGEREKWREEREKRRERERGREVYRKREGGREGERGRVGACSFTCSYTHIYKLAASLSIQILSRWVVNCKMAALTKRSKVNSKFIMPRPCHTSPPEATKQTFTSQ